MQSLTPALAILKENNLFSDTLLSLQYNTHTREGGGGVASGWVLVDVNSDTEGVPHGIMGRRFPDKISQVRPRLDSKYTSSTTPGQQIRVIGCRVAVPRSHWSAVPTLLFIYISQLLRDSFSGNLLPIIP